MFTGLIEDIAKVNDLEELGGDIRLNIQPVTLKTKHIVLGDSIAINGTCLTIVAKDNKTLTFDASKETINRTSLSLLKSGTTVNIEQAMAIGDRLGGHLVSGHVDAVCKLLTIEQDSRSYKLRYEFPATLSQYVAEKGSVCLDGVSLTVNKVMDTSFFVNIIPHTWQNTIMQYYTQGQIVNIEVDLIARYLERLALFSPKSEKKDIPYSDLLKL